MFWMRNKETSFTIRTLIWRPGFSLPNDKLGKLHKCHVCFFTQVCKVCFDEGRGSDGASRSLTAEFKAYKIRGSETRARQLTGQQGLTVSRRQK